VGDDPGTGAGQGGERGQEDRCALAPLDQPEVVAQQQERVVPGAAVRVRVDGVEDRVAQTATSGDLDRPGRDVQAGDRDAAPLQFQRGSAGAGADVEDAAAHPGEGAVVVRLPVGGLGQVVVGRRAVDQAVVALDDLDDRTGHPAPGQRPFADPGMYGEGVADHLAEHVTDLGLLHHAPTLLVWWSDHGGAPRRGEIRPAHHVPQGRPGRRDAAVGGARR
jgi:hypothetical protein